MTQARIIEEVETYRNRVDGLYDQVRGWVALRHPNVEYAQSAVRLDEESTGPYTVQSLEISIPGRFPLRLVPGGIFMLGAHGYVDVRSRLGKEQVVWAEPWGSETPLSPGDDPELALVTRPIFSGVEEGWALDDWRRKQLLHLDADVFWDHLVARRIG